VAALTAAAGAQLILATASSKIPWRRRYGMAIKATTLREDHVSKRETPLGRWFAVILYAVNLALWIAAGIGVEAWNLLWLVVLALPVLGLYLWTTRRHG
jgi:hypothetical protein